MLSQTIHNFGLNLQRQTGNDVSKKASTGSDAKSAEEDLPTLGGAASRRRLRHVSEVALRGLDFEATATGFFLELHAEEGEENDLPLDRSDLFRTCNPTWAPPCGIREGRQLDACELRAVGAAGEGTCWRSTVRLPELEPLGDDLENLKEAPLPGLPMLRLGDRWFSLPGAVSSRLASPPERRRSSVVKQIHASQYCEAGRNVSELLGRLKNLRAQSGAMRQAMEQAMALGGVFHERQEHRATRERRVQELRSESERRRQGLCRLRERLRGAQDCHEQQQAELKQHQDRLRGIEEEYRQASASLPGTVSTLRSTCRQLRCRQIRMLHEVGQVYPIQDCGKYWTIRGLCVAEIDKLGRVDLREEENISTALGFLSHLVVTLANILKVPLRIRVYHAGSSRSYLCDPHESADGGTSAREFPLYYGRGLEKTRFMDALRLLRDGLHQFLYSRGFFDEKRLCAGNLLECADLIIQREMHATA